MTVWVRDEMERIKSKRLNDETVHMVGFSYLYGDSGYYTFFSVSKLEIKKAYTVDVS